MALWLQLSGESLSVDFVCDLSMERRRMLGDIASLPPLLSTPSMISPGDLTENDDPYTDGVAQIDQTGQLVGTPS